MADAEQTLRDLLDKILDEKNYKRSNVEIEAITSEGANFSSALFLINVSSPDRDDLNLFAKVGTIGEQMRCRMNADWLYSNERFVYSKLFKIYKEIEDKHNVPDEHKYKIPIIYGYNDEYGKETVVMENLVASGYKSFNRFKSMDTHQAFAGVQNLAKFHALSFAFAKYYPEEFVELAKNMKYEMIKDGHDQAAKHIVEKMVESSLEVLREDQRDALIRAKIFDSENFWAKYSVPIGQPVLVHGDYRPSNMLYRKQGNNFEVMAVDYQTVYAGTPVCDLLFFIILGTDEEFRRQHFDSLREHYYTELEQALKRLDVDPLEAYPREKFDSDFKKMLPYVVILGVTSLQMVTVEAESAPKMEDDVDIIDINMKTSEVYGQRFRGLIDDCIKWGVI